MSVYFSEYGAHASCHKSLHCFTLSDKLAPGRVRAWMYIWWVWIESVCVSEKETRERGGRERQRERDRQRDRDRKRERDTERERNTERERERVTNESSRFFLAMMATPSGMNSWRAECARVNFWLPRVKPSWSAEPKRKKNAQISLSLSPSFSFFFLLSRIIIHLKI